MLWWTLKQLKAKSPAAREQAVHKLAEQPLPEIIDPIRPLLEDPEAAVRKAVVVAMGRVELDSVPALLVPLLRDPSTDVRIAVAEVLKVRRTAEMIEPLKVALLDPVGVVRALAGQALDSLGWRPEDEASEAMRAVARGDWDRASRLGSVAIPSLSTVLQRDEAGHVRHAALKALSRIKAGAVVGIIIKALKDADRTVRTEAATALSQAGDVAAVEPLIAVLQDEDHRVQAAAADALSRIGDARAIEPLSQLLTAGNWEVRMAAAEALSNIGDARVVDPLIGALKDKDKDVRMVVVQALAQLGNTLAVEPLILALMDVEDPVRRTAAEALKVLDRNWEKSAAARRVLPQVDAALNHRDYWVRQSAASVLVQITQIQSDEPSLAHAGARNKQYRQMAYETLIGLLDDADRDLRAAAAEALGRVGDARAIGPLSARLKDGDSRVRGIAAGTLQKLQRQPDAVRPLRMMNTEE